jgi:hypothetical protein
VGERAEEGRGG